MHIYYLTVSVSHKSGHHFAGSHLEAMSEVLASLISRFKWEKSSSKFVWLLAELRALQPAGRRVLACCWPEATFCSYLVVGWRMPSIPWHMSLPMMSIGVIQYKGKYTSKKGNVITEGTSHCLCHILLARSESEILSTLKGRTLHKIMNVRWLRQLGVILDSVCHSHAE